MAINSNTITVISIVIMIGMLLDDDDKISDSGSSFNESIIKYNNKLNKYIKHHPLLFLFRMYYNKQ